MSKSLPAHFKVTEANVKPGQGKLILHVRGQRAGRPSKRITLNRKNLKVTDAKITRWAKGKPTEHELIRINHLPTVGEIRLHSAEMMFPGEYELVIRLCPPAGSGELGSQEIIDELFPGTLLAKTNQ